MDVKLTLPDEVVEALGPDVEREALEGILLLLVGEGKLPLQRAGEVLGLDDREEAARWYAERASFRLDPEGEIGKSSIWNTSRRRISTGWTGSSIYRRPRMAAASPT